MVEGAWPSVLSQMGTTIDAQIVSAYPDVVVGSVPARGTELPDDVDGQVLLVRARPDRENVQALLERFADIRWLHAFSTGVNSFPLDLVGDRTLTCSRGASAIPIAEWVLAMMLAFEKQLPGSWIEEKPERWVLGDLGELHGKTLGLVGMGGIAVAVAERALPFGMEVVAIRRSPEPSPLPGIEIVTELDQLLARSDHLVLAAAATDRNRHMIGREQLARTKPNVHIVNVARGSLVDQEALLASLDQGHVAMASLDTVDPEPLPEGHPFYTHERVRLSGHVSASSPNTPARYLQVFLDNIARFREGRPLLGEVDLVAGY